MIQYTSVLPRHKSDKSRNGWRVRLHIDKESALEQTSAEFALKTVGGLVTLFINPESTRGNIIPKGTYRFTGSSQQHHGAPPPYLRTYSNCITAAVTRGIKSEANFSILRSLNQKQFIVPLYFLKIRLHAFKIGFHA